MSLLLKMDTNKSKTYKWISCLLGNYDSFLVAGHIFPSYGIAVLDGIHTTTTYAVAGPNHMYI